MKMPAARIRSVFRRQNSAQEQIIRFGYPRPVGAQRAHPAGGQAWVLGL